MNIEEILKYQRPNESYYDTIGCDQSSSTEQINREYRIRALQLHPDKNQEPESLEKFRRLQTAKDVLSDEKLRRSYDCWLNSGIHIPFEQWRDRKGHSMHWSSPRSTKLGLPEGSRQASDKEIVREKLNADTEKVDLLEKFRKYEI